MSLLDIKNLHVQIEDKPILRGLNLTLNAGETHAIMGPNGAGKSTLSHVLAGHEAYEITKGSISYMGEDLTRLSPDERARKGVFLAFQYPLEIEGVSNMTFLKTALDAHYRGRDKPPLDAAQFLRLIREKTAQLGMNDEMLRRELNVGFSGGEKKRNEILQMSLFEPQLAILDETDSGLDIDALKIVAEGVNLMRDKTRAMLVITHYQRLLNYIEPDFVHVLAAGQIVASGGAELALRLEEHGYSEYAKGAA